MRLKSALSAFFVAAIGLGGASANAQTLFAEDFQDGDANGWRAGGDGTVEISVYQGNYSLQLTKRASAVIGLGVEGPPEVIISVAFAAFDLEGKDACIAEASSDNGESWIEINRVEDGADDGVTLHVGDQKIASPAVDVPLILRLRVDANGDNDTCWADNIRIIAASQQTSAAPSDAVQSLSAAFLMSSEELQSPVAMRAFSSSDEALAPAGQFQGRLTFEVEPGDSNLRVLRDNFNFAVNPLPGLSQPPNFDVAFVQSGDALIPEQRGLILTDNQAWDIIIEPGKVWREPDDRGFTRAAVPFALQERNANCTHNGVLTFLFDEAGNTSRAAFQIASETCFYFQYDMWGTAAVGYEPGDVVDADKLITAYEAEQARKLLAKPISMLNQDFPEIDASAFASPADVSPEHLTTYGVVIDGVHYRGDCATRYGPYPFCENIALPSYSTAKSVFAGLGLMRLQKLYPGAVSEQISTHVRQCSAEDWGQVTFGHALDMATGRYNSKAPEADENEAVQDGFFIDLSHQEKIERACTIYPRKGDPGEQWVYHTTDHYILGTAMQRYLRDKNGEDADLYRDLLVDPIWKTLRLSPVTYTTRRTRDDVRQPFVGWGLTYLPDDLAKLAHFIAVDGGVLNGEAVVDAGLLAAALQERPDDRGHTATNDDFRYNNGFWAWNAAETLNCKLPVWIPFMSGFGGVSVVLMPNDIVYYYVSDNQEFAWARAIEAADEYKSMCGSSEQ